MEINATDAISQYSRTWEYIHSGFLILVILVALLGNGFVCIAVFRFRHLQKPSNYFLVSLAASDIFVSLFSFPFRIYFELNVNWTLGKHTCQFWIFIDLLCSTASIVNLSLVSVDRYISLSRPLRYLVLMTVRKCMMGILFVWLFSFILSILSLPTWSKDGSLEYYPECRKLDKVYYTTSTIMAIMLPLTILIVLYYLVFKMAWAQQKQIYRCTMGSFTGQGIGNEPSQNSYTRRHFMVTELKAAKTLIIIVGTFLVCWLPCFIIIFILQYSPSYFASLPNKTQEITGQLFLYTLPALNSALNPFIYTYFNSDIRKVFKKMWRKLIGLLGCKYTNETIDVTLASRNDVQV